MVPRHLVSDSSANSTYKTASYIDNIGNIDPSPPQHLASDTSDVGRSGALLECNNEPKLDRNSLEKQIGRADYAFDWSVRRAIDSGYGSGYTQDQPDLSDPLSQSRPHSLREEDRWASGHMVMFTTGASDGAEVDCREFLNLDEERDRNIPID
jgi:hypothetical protein